ncbi:MAG TPA: hypothetical protein VEJ63_12920 [Planctomycetota bacterium]|nr:hypothetical protein [Planctomycetota bacterium]
MRYAFVCLVVTLAAAISLRAAEGNTEAADLVKKLIDGDATERDSADIKLRKLGKGAVPALRDAKTEKEDALNRVRNTLVDIAIDSSDVTEADANLLHELAREEGKGKRYGNCERLYRVAEQKFDMLKDIADKKKDKAKEKEFSDKQKICDRMKDKAGHKLKGDTHTGVNLGFMKIGKEHNMSDEWE